MTKTEQLKTWTKCASKNVKLTKKNVFPIGQNKLHSRYFCFKWTKFWPSREPIRKAFIKPISHSRISFSFSLGNTVNFRPRYIGNKHRRTAISTYREKELITNDTNNDTLQITHAFLFWCNNGKSDIYRYLSLLISHAPVERSDGAVDIYTHLSLSLQFCTYKAT